MEFGIVPLRIQPPEVPMQAASTRAWRTLTTRLIIVGVVIATFFVLKPTSASAANVSGPCQRLLFTGPVSHPNKLGLRCFGGETGGLYGNIVYKASGVGTSFPAATILSADHQDLQVTQVLFTSRQGRVFYQYRYHGSTYVCYLNRYLKQPVSTTTGSCHHS
jgi:hypothetical protein